MAGHRAKAPTSQRWIVTIDDIDITKRIAHCTDKHLGRIMCSFRESTPLQEIPQPGQQWVAERDQRWEWMLTTRWESTAEHTQKAGDPTQGIPAMNAGDGHLRLPGTLHVRSGAITVASMRNQASPKPMGATYQQRYVGNGGKVSFTLPQRWVHTDTIKFYVAGLLLDPNTLSFDSGITAWTSGITATAPTSTLPGTVVHPSTPNGHCFEALTSGTGGTVEPTWPTTDFATVQDGTITWEAKPTITLASAPASGAVIVIYYEAV